MDLEPVAERAARLLVEAWPMVKFTSGRRNFRDQARAMSHNVARNREWIAQTYKPTTASIRLQAWVDVHPEALTPQAIEEGLYRCLSEMKPAVAGKLSRHLSGLAFDVEPVYGSRGEKIKATIRALPGLNKFLDKEGGRVIWHAQFDEGGGDGGQSQQRD